MSSTSGDEIRGDWNNIRGTEYHLLYALWLVIRDQATSVAFYQGNDLLARPAVMPTTAPPPASADLLDEESPAVTLRAEQGTSDVWVQLKATKTAWTPTRLLEKNLLTNFIQNALYSEVKGREWRASLVTQGLIQRRELENFIRYPRKHPKLAGRVKEIINTIRIRLREEGWKAADLKLVKLRKVAFAILSQLAEAEPVPLEVLKADVEAELTLAYPDRAVVRLIRDTLLGTMLRDAALGPVAAHAYDAEWLNQAAGRPVIKRGMLDADPAAACDAAVGLSLEVSRYEARHFVPRLRLEQALEQFMASDETLFVLVGMSGTGKSWACGHWAGETLRGQLRLLIPGADLDHRRTLESLTAHNLRPFTSAHWRDEQFLQRLTTAAELGGGWPLVIIIDDLLPSGDTNTYRRDLARLVNDCRTLRIKLVLTCQRHVWELYSLGADITPGDLFATNIQYGGAREHYAAPGSPSPRSFSLATDGARKAQAYSYLLTDFSPDELVTALTPRLPRNAP